MRNEEFSRKFYRYIFLWKWWEKSSIALKVQKMKVLNLKLHSFFLKKANFFPKKANFSLFFPHHLFIARNSSSENSSSENSSFPLFLTRIPKYSCNVKVIKNHCSMFMVYLGIKLDQSELIRIEWGQYISSTFQV